VHQDDGFVERFIAPFHRTYGELCASFLLLNPCSKLEGNGKSFDEVTSERGRLGLGKDALLAQQQADGAS
jgi:hypothetical protein